MRYTIRTYSMLRHLWDVVNDDLVWVPENVQLLCSLLVGHNRPNDAGFSVLEDRCTVSSELLPLFLILELLSHYFKFKLFERMFQQKVTENPTILQLIWTRF